MSDPAANLHTVDEALMLHGWVDRQRDQVAGLLDDLTDAEARTRLVPSLTTPLGLVTHATFVEEVWFHHRLAGRSREEVGIPETVDASFIPPVDATVGSVRSAYVETCAPPGGELPQPDVPTHVLLLHGWADRSAAARGRRPTTGDLRPAKGSGRRGSGRGTP